MRYALSRGLAPAKIKASTMNWLPRPAATIKAVLFLLFKASTECSLMQAEAKSFNTRAQIALCRELLLAHACLSSHSHFKLAAA